MHSKSMIVGLFAAGAFLAATVSTAHAVVISDLYNTGVDGAGTPLGGGVDDPHYAIFAQPGAGSLVDSTVPVDGFPIPPWVANDANSRWIGPATADAVGPPGGYIYRTSFTLPVDVDLSTVLITGLWGTDDPGLDILINTASTSNTSSGFGSLTAFSITSGFVVGANTLDFVLHMRGVGGRPDARSNVRAEDAATDFQSSVLFQEIIHLSRPCCK